MSIGIVALIFKNQHQNVAEHSKPTSNRVCFFKFSNTMILIFEQQHHIGFEPSRLALCIMISSIRWCCYLKTNITMVLNLQNQHYSILISPTHYWSFKINTKKVLNFKNQDHGVLISSTKQCWSLNTNTKMI